MIDHLFLIFTFKENLCDYYFTIMDSNGTEINCTIINVILLKN